MLPSDESVSSVAADLVHLSRRLGHEDQDWACVAEGNVSASLGDGTLLVKASGARMREAQPSDFVQVRLAALLELIDGDRVGDQHVEAAFEAARTDPEGKRPSVESLLHAVCVDEGNATVVGHSHPADLNAFLCSSRPELLVQGSLIPDQIVVLGRHQLLVPYVDPGLALARRVRADLRAFSASHGTAPKAIYLANHGFFALGNSSREVLDITEMATKCARVLLGTMTVGVPAYLSAEDCERIDTRPDELLRRGMLSTDAK
ncbi:class II aldolase/adducin family protein [Streptomyces sp. QL37]|uniref:class II aldolase/adducin family protein n=1 Tax=Streptomyces sp. QL37 TaxID=2093747 RepID=UPI000CF2BDE9|nr:class II aldolase/adducin family protein [Streptomyces sp. QL37]PPQ62225.1 aldolase [Streptomyces sp. QL37]